MPSTPRSHTYRLLTLAACLIGAPLAMAQELQDPRDKANRICASYGHGFVAGHMPGHCVKVQERLRVAPSARHSRLEEPTQGFFASQDAPLRDRLRVNGGFGNTTIR